MFNRITQQQLSEHEILFHCSNGIKAIYLKHFGKLKVYFEDKHIDTFDNADEMTTKELCLHLETFALN